ncbi:DUF2808 domain-containing protein [Chroococcus sp. FPU101]|uniref:DUF2808 domain-containing protein n=1 Tax=Chroococcus sp. FPU101 TaxID=1974212 RepID=UPI001A8FA8C9|nr:DUF2808 domain-containing protein [Chroococcus sp. FPU101]GFE68981.1 hypothetical protein CFPU101_15910 [Chroococcus sp. FPU101]
MSRMFIQITAIILAIATLSPAAEGNQHSKITTYPSIVGAVQFPKRKMSFVRHSIKIQIPENAQAISQLKINVPSGLKVENDITIHDESKEKIAANILVNESTIIIDFPQPPKPQSRLEIDMNRVKMTGASNVFTYRVFAKFVGIESELNLGIAEIRTSR